MVSDLLNKRKSLSQSLLAIGADLVTKEIANDLRAVTARLLLQKEGVDTQKALAQGGLIFHQVVQMLSAGATATSQQAQTSSVEAGNATRQASTQAAALAARAAQATAGPAQVMADAAIAFANTYASVSAIPVVGWTLAPGAAEEAFAAVASQSALASLDVGTNYVMRGGLAQIHEGEAIVPKAYNPAAGGAGLGGGGDIHNHFNMGGAIDGPSIDRLVNSREFQTRVAASMQRYFNRGGRG